MPPPYHAGHTVTWKAGEDYRLGGRLMRARTWFLGGALCLGVRRPGSSQSTGLIPPLQAYLPGNRWEPPLDGQPPVQPRARRSISSSISRDGGDYPVAKDFSAANTFGSTERLSNGNFHFGGGELPGHSLEVNPDGTPSYLMLGGGSQYRSFRLRTLYAP